MWSLLDKSVALKRPAHVATAARGELVGIACRMSDPKPAGRGFESGNLMKSLGSWLFIIGAALWLAGRKQQVASVSAGS